MALPRYVADPALTVRAPLSKPRHAMPATLAPWETIDRPGHGARELQFQLERAFAGEQRWSPRKSMLLIVGVSALLWAGIAAGLIAILS